MCVYVYMCVYVCHMLELTTYLNNVGVSFFLFVQVIDFKYPIWNQICFIFLKDSTSNVLLYYVIISSNILHPL